LTPTGIDDIALYVPHLYLDMADFAALRGLDAGKLRHGLGLHAMAVPDLHEDTATMAANAAVELIDRNGLDPRRIGRIYLGTESALDGAKPTATYVLDMLQQRYAARHGEDCFRHCDVVDMTFACIGAVDALHGTLDWVARGGDEDRIGIVLFSDWARYERHSSGEYTQGAGGGALLVRRNPRLLAIDDHWGVSTTPVHDFFKPRPSVSMQALFQQVLDLAAESGARFPTDLSERMVRQLHGSDAARSGIFAEGHDAVLLHRDTPVFDGPLSNRCYSRAVKQAFEDFRAKAVASGRFDPARDAVLTEQWARIVLHLPYAFQGKRMFPDVFRYDRKHQLGWAAIEAEIGPRPRREAFAAGPEGEADFDRADDDYRRDLSNTAAFKRFVAERMEKGQRASSLVGNQYTGSIFLSLVSTLESDLVEGVELAGRRIGLCGYGSGAKAKVFEGTVQPGWKEVAAGFGLFQRLRGRRRIEAGQYEALHRRLAPESVRAPQEEFALAGIGAGAGLAGSRSYAWVDAVG
jgi:hydroxymethylglutaryl-CoA synthase